MRPYPKDFFNSYEEYSSYFHCLNKAENGDKVEIFLRSSNSPSPRPSERKVLVDVIGRRFEGSKLETNLILLLGSNHAIYGFWRLQTDIPNYPMIDQSVIKTHTWGYWAYYTDVRIAKIIKNNG